MFVYKKISAKSLYIISDKDFLSWANEINDQQNTILFHKWNNQVK